MRFTSALGVDGFDGSRSSLVEVSCHSGGRLAIVAVLILTGIAAQSRSCTGQ